MELNTDETLPQFRSAVCGPKPEEVGLGFPHVHGVISGQPTSETGKSSFTALLELPPPQAVELLEHEGFPDKSPPPLFTSNMAPIDRPSRFSVFASADDLPENNSIFSSSNLMKLDAVKQEPLDSDSCPKSPSPAVSSQSLKSVKRKELEKKVNESNKKCKKVVENETSEGGGEKLPYVHVRARRGQATDSHSLAERARREKINARMKLLQDLVPGCNKISGTAMVLDEIINHVQTLQRQVEILSMRLAAVNPRSDINFDALLTEESEHAANNNYPVMFTPSVWPEGQVNECRQQLYQQSWHFDWPQQPFWGREDDNRTIVTPDNSLLTFHSSPNSDSLHSNQLKMEL